KLGESVTEGTITSWLVNEGDQVEKYDPIAEGMTDKVTAEIPSSYTGIMTKLLVEEGKTVDVGSLIAHIEVAGSMADEKEEEINEAKPSAEALSNENKELENKQQSEEVKKDNRHEVKKQVPSSGMRYSPAVLRLASEHGLQLEEIEGSGRGGR